MIQSRFSRNRTPLPGWLACAGLLATVSMPAARATEPAPEPPPSDSGPAILQTLCEDLLDVAKIPSLSFAVAREGTRQVTVGCGVTDLEKAAPVSPDTRFRMASVSKLATATATLRLVQAGALDLDAPLDLYLPEFPGAEKITARQLLGHLSGIAHYQQIDDIDRDRTYQTAREALGVFRDSPRAGEPGAAYRYTTHGYTLVSAALEAASDRPFLEILEREVFEPLDMTASGPDRRDAVPPEMATLYRWVARKNYRIPKPENPSYKWGGGGLISTPSDLVRLGSAYFDDDYLQPGLVAEAFTPQTTADGTATGVGLAWRIGEDFSGRRVIHHAGSMGGARSLLLLAPEEELAIALQTNTAWGSYIESTGQVLLEAWRRRDGLAGQVSGTSAEGMERFTYSGTFHRRRSEEPEAVSGTLELGESLGHLEVAEPVGAWLDRERVDHLRVRPLGDDLWAVVTPLGIAAMRLDREGDRLMGRADLGSRDVLEIEILRSP